MLRAARNTSNHSITTWSPTGDHNHGARRVLPERRGLPVHCDGPDHSGGLGAGERQLGARVRDRRGILSDRRSILSGCGRGLGKQRFVLRYGRLKQRFSGFWVRLNGHYTGH